MILPQRNSNTIFSLIILIAFSFAKIDIQAQNYEAWGDYNPYFEISDNIQLFGEVGFRTQLKNVKNRQFISSINISHKITSWLEILGGVRDFYSDLNIGLDINEIRPWLGGKVSFSGPGDIKISNYLRSEYRSIRIIDYKTDSSFRFRYQLGVTFPIWSNLTKESILSGIVDVEVFADTKDGFIETFAERMRFRFGLSYNWIKSLRFELFYTAQRAGKERFEVDDHIFRFQMKHYLNY